MPIDKYNQSVFLTAKAAYMYYIGGESQRDIAEALSISITTVSRLLKKAKEDGIIEFVIRDPYVKCMELEKEIKNRFGLKDVIIAPVAAHAYGGGEMFADPEDVKKSVALEGARYLQRIIRPNDVLGVTWGSTVYHMFNYLNPAQKVDATFVTLHGSLGFFVNEWDVRTLVSRITRAFYGKNYSLPTDTLISSKEMAKLLKREKNVARVFRMFDRINISIAGMGSIYPQLDSILTRPEYLSPEEVALLQSKGAMGDIALHFFDRNGRECDTDLKERTIAIDFERYKKINTKIVVASDPKKAHTLLAALRGKLIDVLIIDSELAKTLLGLNEDPVMNTAT